MLRAIRADNLREALHCVPAGREDNGFPAPPAGRAADWAPGTAGHTLRNWGLGLGIFPDGRGDFPSADRAEITRGERVFVTAAKRGNRPENGDFASNQQSGCTLEAQGILTRTRATTGTDSEPENTIENCLFRFFVIEREDATSRRVRGCKRGLQRCR